MFLYGKYIFCFSIKKFTFLESNKKSINLIKILQQILFIQIFGVLALKLLFFVIFRRGKISQMKKNGNCVKIPKKCAIFIFLLSNILKIQTFLNKIKTLLLKFGWKIIQKHAFKKNLKNSHFSTECILCKRRLHFQSKFEL